MSESLKVIALISGGKDSFFSMLHCIENGHRIIALANLHPTHPTKPQDGASVDLNHATIPFQHHPTAEGSDLNSFMYQTVGHSLVPLYATALQLPLYRRPITGTSVQQSQYYDTSSTSQSGVEADETEDLVPLLRQIIRSHPEANAVSTGAILSTYQRTRVESVALRLGLTPIGYLWQYPVLPPPTAALRRPDSLTALLEDMAASGLEARIIKIASAGIPESLLFSNVTDPQTRSQLIRGLALFFEGDELGLRGAVLGEGGEYETLALNGPESLWKGGRIEIDETLNKSYTEGGVTYLHLGSAKVVPRSIQDEGDRPGKPERPFVSVPGLLDPQFVLVSDRLQSLSPLVDIETADYDSVNLLNTQNACNDVQLDTQSMQVLQQHRAANSYKSQSGQYVPVDLSYTSNSQLSTVAINNLTSASIASYLESRKSIMHSAGGGLTAPSSSKESDTAPVTSTPSSAAGQLQTILSSLPQLLDIISASHFSSTVATTSLPLKLTHITSAVILLSAISDFPTINPIYSSGIWPPGLPNPPARVTIAAPLAEHTKVSLSLTLDVCQNPLSRQGLHVQGRSYWAPANIGPYSQAISVPLFRSSRIKVQDASSNRNTQVNDGDHAETDAETDDDNSSIASALKVVHIAGQIPLIPASMNLNQGSFSDSTVLSLQHLWRVGQERGVDAWPWSVTFLAKYGDESERGREHADIAGIIWRQAHPTPTQAADDEDESESRDNEEQSIDIWDLQHNMAANPNRRFGVMGTAAPAEHGKHLRTLPNHDVFEATRDTPKSYHVPPFVAAEVDSLPRNASVEWWSQGIAGLTKSSSSTVTPSCHWSSRTLTHGSLSCLTILPDRNKPREAVKFITYLISSPPSRTGVSSAMEGRLLTTPTDMLRELQGDRNMPSSVRLVHGVVFTPTLTNARSDHEVSTSETSLQKLICSMTTIPCHRLWGYPASSVTKSDRRAEDEDDDSALVSKGSSRNSRRSSSLLTAFMLRVDVNS